MGSTIIEPPQKELIPFVEELLKNMTLEEKVGQLNQYSSTWDVTGPPPVEDESILRLEQIKQGRVGSMLNVLGSEATRKMQEYAVNESRLGIPLLFGYDLIHGYKTIFPIPLAESCSWDLEYIRKAAAVGAKEAAACGVHWAFAPMMDISRDARWGRIMEGSGEDPYLGARIAEARVTGLQGPSLSLPNTVAATAKHFIGYGFVIAGLDYNTVELSEHTLYNVVLPPFKAAVKAGVAAVMNAFNDVNGVLVTANKKLQRDLLRKELGFKGVLVSDWDTIGEMTVHKFAKNLKEAAKHAIIAGTDVDMESRGYDKYLQELVQTGEVDISLIDDAVRRVLTLKYKLGLFDDPFRYCSPEREQNWVFTKKHRQASREMAKRSMVLLKNEEDLLPLSKNESSIAVIGALAADKDAPIGSWRGQADKDSAVSLLEGVQQAVSDATTVRYAQGYTLANGERSFTQELKFDNATDISLFDEAIKLAKTSDKVIVALGEECFQTGEARSQTDIRLKGAQIDLLKQLWEVNKHIIVVLMNGRPIAEPWLYETIPSILECWYLGTESGHAIADVLFGDYNPSGKLSVSIPRSVGQVPVYYNHNQTGRPVSRSKDPDFVFWTHYTDTPRSPQFPFGYGLSYTTFEYSDLKLSSSKIALNEELIASITVTNTGHRAGEEVVQLYINDLYASSIRPVKELKGFKKIKLEAGESRTLKFTLNWETLAFYNRELKFVAEPGEFEVMIGGNSQDVLTAKFELIADKK